MLIQDHTAYGFYNTYNSSHWHEAVAVAVLIMLALKIVFRQTEK